MKPQELIDIEVVQGMCERSLAPEVYEQWENVKRWLFKNRGIMDSDTEEPANDNPGLYEKYIVRRSDGSAIPYEADFFVLRIDKDKHAKNALVAYAESLHSHKECPKLHSDLMEKVVKYDAANVHEKDGKIVFKAKSGMYGEMPEVHLGTFSISMMSDKEEERKVWMKDEHSGEGMEFEGSLLQDALQTFFDENM